MKARCAAIRAGPTVDKIDYAGDAYNLCEKTVDDDTQDWTETEAHEAKLTHLRGVIEANNSYEVCAPSEHPTAFRLTTTWVTVRKPSDEGKARLCART